MEINLRVVGLFLVFAVACHSSYTPKPKGYFRIDYPSHTYTSFNEKGVPFSFDYPLYAKVVRDTTYFNSRPDNPYWYNISMPVFQGNIHLTYKPINTKNTLEGLVNDAHKLTYKHSSKADYIDENPIHINQNKVYGVYYSVSGDAASSIQFYITDSSRHFVRGALYFATAPNSDSLAPVIKFVQKDLVHMIDTWHWNY